MEKITQRNASMKWRYGLYLEDLDEIYESQDHRCAICNVTEAEGPKNRFHVDHDHESGEVRGLLCQNCNIGLGKFKDNVEFLEQAIAYLKAGY
jgi:hypothetical protein